MEVTIPELITRINTYDEYKNITKSNYRSKIGNKDKLIQTLKKLEDCKFQHFEKLLPELQSTILGYNGFKKSQVLNKSVSRYTQQAYFQQYCNLLISKEEIVKYQPDRMFVFIMDTKDMDTIIYYNQWVRFKNDYVVDTIYLDKVNNLIEFLAEDVNKYDILTIKDNFKIDITKVKLDLLTTYKILKARNCETIRPGYAKVKVIEELKSFQSQTDINDYQSLIVYWTYLTVNCKQFPILQKYERFRKLGVTVNDGGAIILVEGAALTGDELMFQLQTSCEYWFQLLTKWINLLD